MAGKGGGLASLCLTVKGVCLLYLRKVGRRVAIEGGGELRCQERY